MAVGRRLRSAPSLPARTVTVPVQFNSWELVSQLQFIGTEPVHQFQFLGAELFDQFTKKRTGLNWSQNEFLSQVFTSSFFGELVKQFSSGELELVYRFSSYELELVDQFMWTVHQFFWTGAVTVLRANDNCFQCRCNVSISITTKKVFSHFYEYEHLIKSKNFIRILKNCTQFQLTKD